MSPEGPERSGGAAKRLDETRGGGYSNVAFDHESHQPGSILSSTPGSFLMSAEGWLTNTGGESMRCARSHHYIVAAAIVLAALLFSTSTARGQSCNASGFGYPVADDNPNDNLRWGVPYTPFGEYVAYHGGHHPAEDWNLVGGSANADLGKPVIAIGTGTVVKISNLGSLGYLVALEHTGSFNIPAKSGSSNGQSSAYGAEAVSKVYSIYLHINSIKVALNDCVSRGQEIGNIMDPNGGPHLHFEIRRGDAAHSGNWSMILPSSNWYYKTGENGPYPTGYYINLQQMVNVVYRHPRSFIEANQSTGCSGELIKDSSNPIYWKQNNKIYHVFDGGVLTDMETEQMPCWSWTSVRQTSVSFPQGPELITSDRSSNGLLIRIVKPTNTGKVYVIQNGQRRGFYSEEALTAYGGDTGWFSDVIEVPSSLVSSYAIGNDIYGVGEGEPVSTIKNYFKNKYSDAVTACASSSSWKGWPGSSFAECVGFAINPVSAAYASGYSGNTGKFQKFGDETGDKATINYSARGTYVDI